jgi:hypothetical protein
VVPGQSVSLPRFLHIPRIAQALPHPPTYNLFLRGKLKTRSSIRHLELGILAHGWASLSVAELADLRQKGIERFSARLRPPLLKHSDEQTLAAALALDRAIARMEGSGTQDLSRWAIVSATRYLGRTAFAAVIDKYKIDGPWGVSVQVIPHTSPHALASSLSLALASHGPCLGAGASPGEEPNAVLTAATLLAVPNVAGAWVVFSGWTDTTAGTSRIGVETCCQAAVLALVPRRSADHARTVGRIRIGASARDSVPNHSNHQEPVDLLNRLVESGRGGGALAAQVVSGGLQLQVELGDALRTPRRPAKHLASRPRLVTATLAD